MIKSPLHSKEDIQNLNKELITIEYNGARYRFHFTTDMIYVYKSKRDEWLVHLTKDRSDVFDTYVTETWNLIFEFSLEPIVDLTTNDYLLNKLKLCLTFQ